MLRKLIKYDLRSCMKIFPLILLAMAGLAGLIIIGRAFDISQIQVMATVFLAILGSVAYIASMVVVAMRYYKGLFGAQGYLYQTLPVSAGQLVASKVITAVICIIVGTALLLVSIGTAIFANLHNMADFQWNTFFDAVQQVFGSSALPLIIFLLVAIAVGVLLTLSVIFAAISIAHTSTFIKNSFAISIAGYFVINMIVSFIQTFAVMFIPLGIRIGEDGSVRFVTEGMLETLFEFGVYGTDEAMISSFTIGVGNVITDILCIVALICLSVYLLKRKTSVK